MAVVIPFISTWDNKALLLAGKDLRSAGSQITRTGQLIGGVGKGLTAAVTLPIIAIGAMAMKSAGDFAMANRVFQQHAGATGPKLDAMNASFKRVFSTVSENAAQTAEAITIIGQRTGATGTVLDDLSRKSLELNRMIGGELKTQIEGTQRAMANWGVAAQDQGAMMDYLYGVSQQTGVGYDQLTASMQAGGPALRELGISFKTGATLIGGFEKAGVNGETATKSFTLALKTMAKDGVKDPAAALPGLIDKIKNAATTGDAAALAFKYFGKSGVVMLDAIRSGKVDIASLTASMDTNGSSIDATAEKTMTWTQSLERMKNELETALQPLGAVILAMRKDLLPILKDGIAWIARISAAFSALPDSTKRAIVIGAMIAAAVGPALIVIGQMVTGVGGMVTMFGKMASAAGGATGATAGGFAALGPVVAVIAAVAAAAALLVAAFGGVKGFMKELASIGQVLPAQFRQLQIAFKALAQAFGPALAAIGAAIKPALAPIRKAFDGIAREIIPTITTLVQYITAVWKFIAPVVIPILAGLAAAVGQIFAVILNVVRAVMALLRGDLSGAWTAIKAAAVALWNGIYALVDGVVTGLAVILHGFIVGVVAAWTWLSTTSVAIWGAIGAWLSALWNGLLATSLGVWNAIGSGIVAAWNWVMATSRAVWSGIGAFVAGVWEGMKSSASAGVAAVVGFVSGLPSRITGAFSGAGQLLYNIGSSIIDGLLRGGKRAWEAVVAWLAGLGAKIKALKGPIEKDRVMLVDEGHAIIASLGNGMKAAWPGVQSMLSGFSDQIAGTAFGGPSLAFAGGPSGAFGGGGSGAFGGSGASISGASITIAPGAIVVQLPPGTAAEQGRQVAAITIEQLALAASRR